MLKGLVVFSLCSLFCATCGQYLEVPPIACPNYFQYLLSGSTYIGKITLPNLQMGSTQVDVQFSQRVPVQSNYYGSLALYQDQQTTIHNLQSGQPVSYRVDFPLINVVPKLTQIALNGRVICSASEYPTPSTSLKLQHTLRTTVTTSGGRPYNTNTVNNFDNFIQEVYQNQVNPFFSIPFTFPRRQQTTVSVRPNEGSTVYYKQQPTQPVIYRTQPQEPQRTQPQVPQRIQPHQPPQQVQPEPQPEPQPEVQPQVHQRVTESAVCGQEGAGSSNFSPYIYGGRPLRRGEYPWLTAIYKKHTSGVNFICGGSLISSSLVLSAAHCFDFLTSDKISVTLGRYNLSNSMEDVVSRDIQNLIVHPEYKPGGKRFPDADLALLRMYALVSFTSLISPICLWTEPADESLIVGQSAMVAGWGTDENNIISAVPKKVETDVVSDRECLSSSPGFYSITSERTLCAGKRDGSGPCVGDSGSGLMMLRNNRWVLRGIVSAGQTEQMRCNLLEYVLYCDVAKHITWVQGYLQPTI